MHFLSMPLEYSIEVNYYAALIMKHQINFYQKEERFNQLTQMNSPILLSRRSLFLNKKIASQLILAAFNIGPQSVHGSTGSDDNMDKEFERDKKDFNK